jgi:hypothetical protein
MADRLTAEDLPGVPVPRLPIKKPRPKGLAPYAPRPRSKNARILSAAVAVVERHRDRWPLGPREIGYLLTADEFGFVHDDVDLAEDVVVRACRAGLIPWEAISDGRTANAAPWVATTGEEIADNLLAWLPEAQSDRQAGQAIRVELWAEAAGWLTRLERNANERGVVVRSGSGSVPVPAIRAAALRAIAAYPTRTVLLAIGDLDLNGIRNIARPFEADVLKWVADLGRMGEDQVADVIAVRRLLITPDQVVEHVGERGRAPVTATARRAGWPWPWTVQAEALPPEVRDRLVIEAIDQLHDVEQRERVIATEAALHEDARRALAERLRDGGS